MIICGNCETRVYPDPDGKLRHDCKGIKADSRYDELLMAVEDKHPNESRHQTALRLLKEGQRDLAPKNAFEEPVSPYHIPLVHGGGPADQEFLDRIANLEHLPDLTGDK